MKDFRILIFRFLGKSGTTLMLSLGLLLAGFVAHGQQLVSPDHNLSLTFSLTRQGAPMYALTYKGKTVLKPSLMGFELVNLSIPQSLLLRCARVRAELYNHYCLADRECQRVRWRIVIRNHKLRSHGRPGFTSCHFDCLRQYF